MTNAPLIRRRDQLVAEKVAQQLPILMSNRSLKPAFSNFYITAYLGIPIFIAVLDVNVIGDHSRYIHADTLHQISTDLGGRKVYLSNSTGIRYIILLGPLPRLPHNVDLPADIPQGMAALGVRLDGTPIQIPWSRLGHLLVAGMTGSGKSVMLRSIAMQAIRNGLLLGLADIDQTTFPMLDNHSNLFTPLATTPQAALEMIQKALAECDARAGLFKQTKGYPENIDEYNAAAIKAGKEPLKRVLVILDESSAVLQAMGGSTGEMAGKLAELGWRGRKFGIHFVFGGQEFTKQLVGAVREQVNMSIAFRVRPTAAHMAKAIGCDGAHRIPSNRPGMAIVDRYGPMQAYYIPKPLMLAAGTSVVEPISDQERALFIRAMQKTEGKLTIANISEWGGVSSKQARRLQSQWAIRGWIAKDPKRDNSFCIMPKTQEIVANGQTRQTGQTGTNQEKGEKPYEK
jgi:hypothetical protein